MLDTATNLSFPNVIDDHALIDVNALLVHVDPLFVLYDALELPLATATNIPFPYATLDQVDDDDNVAAVHVEPKVVEYAALVPPLATATNVPFPYVTLFHVLIDGRYDVFAVIKPELENNTFDPGIADPPLDIITQYWLPYAISCHDAVVGNVDAVQLVPSIEVEIVEFVDGIAINFEFP